MLLAAASPVHAAAPAIGAEQVVVRGAGWRVAIDRSPLRIAFADARGRARLAQVPNSGQAPLASPGTPDPVPLGNDAAGRPTLYAPLTFTVGAARDFQYPAQQWNGNMLAGTEAGITYSARDVVGVTREGDGLRLEGSPSDPTGRRPVVEVGPGPRGSARVRVTPTPADGVATMGDSFTAGAREAFHGFGGRHDALDQRGADFYNWIEQENLGAGSLQPGIGPLPGTGGDGYQFPNGSAAAYWIQSSFVSSRGYGFMLDRDEISRWRMASDAGDAWQVSAAAPELSYLVAPARSARAAMRRLSAVGGRHRPPPRWALRGQLDRA